MLTTKPVYFPPTYLLPISDTKFILEDIETSLTFTLDNQDYQAIGEITPDQIVYGKLIQS